MTGPEAAVEAGAAGSWEAVVRSSAPASERGWESPGRLNGLRDRIPQPRPECASAEARVVTAPHGSRDPAPPRSRTGPDVTARPAWSVPTRCLACPVTPELVLLQHTKIACKQCNKLWPDFSTIKSKNNGYIYKIYRR